MRSLRILRIAIGPISLAAKAAFFGPPFPGTVVSASWVNIGAKDAVQIFSLGVLAVLLCTSFYAGAERESGKPMWWIVAIASCALCCAFISFFAVIPCALLSVISFIFIYKSAKKYRMDRERFISGFGPLLDLVFLLAITDWLSTALVGGS